MGLEDYLETKLFMVFSEPSFYGYFINARPICDSVKEWSFYDCT